MRNILYTLRFELFLSSQLAILFGALILPHTLFNNLLGPLLFILNLLAGMLLLSKRSVLVWLAGSLLVVNAILFVLATLSGSFSKTMDFIRMGSYFLFYLFVTLEIIHQIWHAREVSKNVIFGLMSGYLGLGLIGFFVCLSIEMAFPGSFQGLLITPGMSPEDLTGQLMYFSFITLLTIGYGDIAPVTELAQKGAVLIGLIGQFYLVIITAVVMGKFVNQRMGNNP
ncbi:MAG: potassium channel family protein [Bacteroidota bacterium]